MTVGIIGGGIMGLVIASRLSRLGNIVHVMESESQLGGLATWFDYKDFFWDKFYHVILPSDHYLIDLIDELNLSDQLMWTPTKSGFLWHKQYISMNNHWELLTFPALTAYQKARLVGGILACQFWTNPEKLHHVKAKDWLASVFGNDVYKIIWDPLLESKFGSLKESIPAGIMHSTIMRYRQSRKTSSGQEIMGHLKGGLKVLIERLAQDIISRGGKITCNCKVTSITEQSKNVVVNTNTAQQPLVFERVINTLPTFIFQKIAPDIKGLYREQGQHPQFLGVICLSLVLGKAFSPFYLTNILDRGYPFTGIVEPSNVGSSEEFNGKHLLMLPRYEVPNSPWFDKSDQEIKEAFLEKLNSIRPGFSDGIEKSFVQRARMVQALWIDSVPLYSEPQRNEEESIWIVNSELSQGHTLSNNNIVEIATKALKKMTWIQGR